MMKRCFSAAAGLAGAGLFLFCVFYAFGLMMRPDIHSPAPRRDPEDIAAVTADRDVSFDPGDPPVLHVEADYSLGEQAPWFPKGQSPFLEELVDEGKLPPVHERVGPEPAVFSGPDGIGNYGGTWHRAASSEGDVSVISFRLSGAHLMRWSPLGYPLMPHLARKIEASPDRREYVIHLRRGIHWSDGHPFTARDILYWWEHEVKHFEQRVSAMRIRGETGDIEKIDEHAVRITFPHPNGLFPEHITKTEMWSPEHYLRPYHPELGDPDRIERMMEVQGVPSPRTAYFRLKGFRNPEMPRMWPWVPRAHQASPPYEFVRNPYYWAVDTEGNQLPYVDRVLFHVRSEGMISVMASSGDITMQQRHIRYDDYTLYMDERESGGYEVYHWFPGERSLFTIFPNINRRIDPADPATRWKHQLLNDRRFRQALSLAINRDDIIKSYFHGQAEPAQLDPGPESLFHHPRLYRSFVEYDPERANALLDETGLEKRDGEGFRTFPDGTRMTFFLNITDYTGPGPAQFILDDWAEAGVRVILYDRTRTLWQVQQSSLEHDFSVWSGESEFYPLVEPRNFVPTTGHSFYAPGFAFWNMRGGLYGHPDAYTGPRTMEPPENHPLRRAMQVLEEAKAAPDPESQQEIFREALDIAADNLWSINIATPPPRLTIVSRDFRNVPRNAITGHIFNTPANAGIETYFFDAPEDSPGAIARMKRSMTEIRPDPSLSLGAAAEGEQGSRTGRAATGLVRYLIYGTAALFIILVSVKHPFIGRRCLILIPTLFVISVATFTIIQLPPGDYITHRITELEMDGDESAIQQMKELKEIFRVEDPMVKRYLRWLGVYWFSSFSSRDMGLLQGRLGLSMQRVLPVNELVGDRILLTFLISFFTILFTWAAALPIGIYSAVRQYSPADYFFTFAGFLGLSFPNFLLALVLMYVSSTFFGIHVGGLFSPEYMAQPEWTWGKFVDLLQHIWIPVIVLGTAGTAGMIRVMRGNLLDELRKPYVVTARARGVRPVKLLFKYPVRLALNPFISGIGNIFPQLVSGGAIVALVLSLPTVGPLLLESLMAQDMYLAGSLLMVLSLLTVFGTLVSDLLLMWLDPRIRMGGSR